MKKRKNACCRQKVLISSKVMVALLTAVESSLLSWQMKSKKILDKLEKYRGAGPDSVQRRPEESVESEDSIVDDSGSNQTASSHVPTENTQSYGKDTNPKKRKRPSAAPSFATNSLSPDDMHKSCDECLISSE